MGAMLLTFMFILADFGVSSVLGAPNQIHLMTTQIYYMINNSTIANNLQVASAYSLFLSLFGLVGLWVYNRVLATNKFVVVSGKSAAVEPTKLNKDLAGPSFAILVILLPVHNLCTNPCNADHITDQDLRSSIRSGEHDIPELCTDAADPECGKSI